MKLYTQLMVLAGVALIMTVGVYGAVAGIVKLDDAGLYLSRRTGRTVMARWQRLLGAAILKAAPYLMKGLSVAGTAAMFLVGGGIITHGLPMAHGWMDDASGVAGAVMPAFVNVGIGLVAGAAALLVVTVFKRLVSR